MTETCIFAKSTRHWSSITTYHSCIMGPFAIYSGNDVYFNVQLELSIVRYRSYAQLLVISKEMGAIIKIVSFSASTEDGDQFNNQIIIYPP